jgi:hypothetical protein
MKTLVAMVAVYSLLGSVGALSQEQSNHTVVGTAGTSSCGSWTESRGDNSKYGFVLASGYQNWVLGFLSGANTEHQADILKNTDLDSVWAWVNNYCQSHPQDQISTAVEHLVVELDRKAGGGRQPRRQSHRSAG